MRNVYEQRINVAIQAALSGKSVTFYLDGSSPTYLTWRNDRGKRHVISAGTRSAMALMLPEVQAEFSRGVYRVTVQPPESFEESQVERRSDAARVS